MSFRLFNLYALLFNVMILFLRKSVIFFLIFLNCEIKTKKKIVKKNRCVYVHFKRCCFGFELYHLWEWEKECVEKWKETFKCSAIQCSHQSFNLNGHYIHHISTKYIYNLQLYRSLQPMHSAHQRLQSTTT